MLAPRSRRDRAELAPRSRSARAELALSSRRARAVLAPRSRRDRAEIAPRSRRVAGRSVRRCRSTLRLCPRHVGLMPHKHGRCKGAPPLVPASRLISHCLILLDRSSYLSSSTCPTSFATTPICPSAQCRHTGDGLVRIWTPRVFIWHSHASHLSRADSTIAVR